MRLIIDLTYHGNKVAARHVEVKLGGPNPRTIKIDIGRLLDARIQDAVNRALKLREKEIPIDKPGTGQ